MNLDENLKTHREVLPIDLVHGFRTGSSFVAGLLSDEQRVLYRLR